MLRTLLITLAFLAAPLAQADTLRVPAGSAALARALEEARAGDVLILLPGLHAGPVTIDKSLTLTGEPGARIDAGGTGSAVTVTAPDVTVSGLELTGSGRDHDAIDAGVTLTRSATRALVENNQVLGNLYGIDIHGAADSIVRGNTVVGLQLQHMNSRGNGIYIWNAPGAVVENNDIRFGRDGIYSMTSRKNTYRNNLMRDLRFAVHYMYTNDSEISGNTSIGNHLGFALMYSDRITVRDNVSLNDRDHGMMLNYTKQSDLFGNLVTGGTGKCTFIYNSHRNLLARNLFEGCDIGIHFTAGSERNVITGNGFVGNRTQVKYVGTRDVEWSYEREGNYWSDHPAFDLNGDRIADSPYRPNDLMDHILWSQPAAGLLLGAPAVQLIRWSQASFPATLPGGVVDSFPMTSPVTLAIPAPYRGYIDQSPIWRNGPKNDSDFNPLASH